jgi:S1-C subfamily serine protease
MRFPSCLLSLPVLLAAVGLAGADGPADSVVKVCAMVRGPDLFRPWTKQNAFESSGSGVVIKGNRILTNAHVVLYASEIFVQGKEEGDKVEARIAAINTGIDLALLTVSDKDFFAHRPAVPIAKKPPQERDAVEVYGYPLGGTGQSVTKGIVSRIDFVPYGNMVWGLRVQIDAALNPGNSGGPALSGNEMIGLAFSRFPVGIGANIGYIIANEEIEAFLRDPTPRPRLAGQFQPLQNETLRKKLKLGDKTQGVLVSQDHGPLRKFDVLTRLGSYELDNQGLLRGEGAPHYFFEYVVPRLAKDGNIPVTVVRDGKEVALSVPVSNGSDYVLRELRGEYPAFFLYGPLVFTPATLNTAGQLARGPNLDVKSPLLTRRGDTVRFPGEELVHISSPMFRHKSVRGYNDPLGRVVDDINGTKIKNLRHLVEVLRDCKDEFISFGFAGETAEALVLSRAEMAAVTQEVMDENGIPRRGSPELVELWGRKHKN